LEGDTSARSDKETILGGKEKIAEPPNNWGRKRTGEKPQIKKKQEEKEKWVRGREKKS